MANTLIQLKFSTATDIPPSLNTAEPAYSFSSNTLFIGLEGAVINIGGQYYTSQIDDATSASTNDTLVKRDASGNFSANIITATLYGNANTATKLETARSINITGDATGTAIFDGSANADITLDLSDTGVIAGTYGGTTQIPTFTVDTEGRLTSAANVEISTTLQVAADSGTSNVSLVTDTFTINGRDGITTVAVDANNTVLIDVDNTVIRTTGNQTIDGDFIVTGNLSVTGNVVYHGADDLIIDDPIVVLANNNIDNVIDIGFVGKYGNGAIKELGLIHHAASDKFYLFTGYEGSVETTNILNIADPTIVTATLIANLEGGTVSNLSAPIAVGDGGTGANTFASGQIVVGNGTGALQSLANTGTPGTYGNTSHVPVITTDEYGRVSSVTNTAITIDVSSISGVLPVTNGGLGANSFTTGEQIVYNGTNFISLANVSTTATGTLSSSNTITSITTDGYGRLTAFTAAPIAIDSSQIVSGTITVPQGGTGATTFTTNGVLLGQGTSALTTVSSSTEGHILTINNSGVPTFQMLSGGTF